MGAMPNKTDRNDARAIAQIMRTGWFREVHVKDRRCRAWRSLLVARRTVLNEMRGIENEVRAILHEVGLKLGTTTARCEPAINPLGREVAERIGRDELPSAARVVQGPVLSDALHAGDDVAVDDAMPWLNP